MKHVSDSAIQSDKGTRAEGAGRHGHWGLKRLLAIFATGLLTLLPVGGTVLILAVLLSFVYEWIGPGSKAGGLLISVGFGGGEREFLRYFLGLGLTFLFVFVVGVLAEMGLKRGFRDVSDRLMKKIPVAKTVYETIGNFISLLSKKDDGTMGGMSPVWCSFGGECEVLVLGLLSSPEVLTIKGKQFFAVIVPTAPVPVGGGLFFIETHRVTEAKGVGAEGLTSIYVSMGVTAPQYIKSE